VEIDPEELARRLEEAARARTVLRRATLEWRALGERLLLERELEREGPDGPHDRDARGR
jgi:hypothetical protein